MSEQEAKEEVKTVTVKPIGIGSHGDLMFSDHTELSRAANLMMKLKMAPEHLRKEGVEAVAAAMLFCRQFGLPDKAMGEMAWVKGKLTQFGSLVTALAERHPQYGDKREFFLDEEQEVICSTNKNLHKAAWAAVCIVNKKGSQISNEYVFTIDDARKAGLLSNPTWEKYTKDMLMHKARARALRSNYASALNGVAYHEDVMEAFEKDVTPPKESMEDVINDLAT